MLYRVTHTTTYDYSESVSLSHNMLRVIARNSLNQQCHRSRLFISPTPASSTVGEDYFGNPTNFITILDAHKQFRVTAINVTEVHKPHIPDVAQTPPWEHVRDRLRNDRTEEFLRAYEFVFPSLYIPGLKEFHDYSLVSFRPNRPILEAVLDLTNRIYSEFTYDPRATSIATPLREVLDKRKGVCQDFAHLQIGCLRSLGLAARYVSGYLLTSPPPGQPRLQGADASHAWLSVFVPGTGWIEVDPTNNMIPSDQHILLAWGRDYDNVGPIRGVITGGGQHTVHVGVDVEEISHLD
ncbi:MAG: transglutaminase domain-containing protein [Gemmataceae bacterium]